MSTDRYSFSAKATAVVSRYMYGIPHYRLSQMQRAAGNPVSPTSLFEMSEDVMDAAYPVYRRLHAVKRYAEFMLNKNKVEHNNALGKAFKYWNRHWMGLTAFCRVEGCPIDNNVAERWMKKYIRHRKNSLFYKTEMGALVGDILMSVGYTAAECNLDPHAYFIVLQENSEDVKTNPDNWLPWNYAARRNLEESSPQAA